MFPHLVPIQEYLGDVELVDVPGVGDDDGRLGVAAPPRVVVNRVVLDGDVVPLGGHSCMMSTNCSPLFVTHATYLSYFFAPQCRSHM